MPEFYEKNTLKDSFPSNSITSKASPPPEPEDKKIKKVVTGIVTQKKTSFGKRFAELFLEENTKSVGEYVLVDVLIPAAKALISEMVNGSVDMLLFGERKGNRTTRDGSKSYISYGSFYNSREKERSTKEREFSKQSRAKHDFGEIILQSRGEAEEVLSNLVDLTIDYGEASVADFYGFLGISSVFTDNKYGWTNLKDSSVSRVRNGYLINLPRPQPLSD